jgi:hypothetical protein
MLGGEKVIDGGLRLKLSHNSCQRGSVVMDFGFLHTALSVFTIEEVEYSVERLLGIIQHVSECPGLTILKKTVTRDDDSGHFGLQSGWLSRFRHSYSERSIFAPTNIVTTTTEMARAIPRAACERVTPALPPGLPEGTQRPSGD